MIMNWEHLLTPGGQVCLEQWTRYQGDTACRHMWSRALEVDSSHLASLERQFLETEALNLRIDVSLLSSVGRAIINILELRVSYHC